MDHDTVSALRSDLAAADFTVDALREAWGDEADAALTRGDRVPASRALAGRDDPLAVLASLFILGEPRPEPAVAGALASAGLARVAAAGLVETLHGATRALVDLRPYDVLGAVSESVVSWWIVSDLGELSTGAELREDHVLGIGGASRTLSGMILPRPVHTALDLGTGCGIQALHLSRFADGVIASDISQRAVDFASLTAAINGVDRIDVRLGDFFAPLGDERVDLIVSNPPFVITPRAEGVPAYEYRDAGRVGDALLFELIAQLPSRLTDGGIAQMLGNWEYSDAGGSGLDRVAEAARAAGLEYWIVERERLSPAHYAETWIRDGGARPGTVRYDDLVDAWLDDFEQRGIDAIGFGYLLLRRPIAGGSTPPLQRTEILHGPLGNDEGGLGAHLDSALRMRDTAAALSDAALLECALLVAPDVTEERSHWPGSEHPSAIILVQGGGFGRRILIDSALAAVVGASDGELSLGVITGAVAELLAIDDTELRVRVVAEVRELIECGLVIF